MTPEPALDAVLFDLDGVLIDSYEVWFHVVNDVAARFGVDGVTKEAFRQMFGQGLEADIRLLYPGRTMEEVRLAFEDGMLHRLDEIVVNDEAVATLEHLLERKTLRAIVTNTQDDVAERLLEVSGLAGHVEAVAAVGGGLREKPHPDLVFAALERIGVAPHRTVLVGDSRYDEQAAANAGVPYARYVLTEGGSLLARVQGLLSPRRATS